MSERTEPNSRGQEPEEVPVATIGDAPDSNTDTPTPEDAPEPPVEAEVEAGIEVEDAAEDDSLSDQDKEFADLRKRQRAALVSAFDKAQKIMAFAIERGIEMKPEDVQPVNAAIRAFGTSDWNSQIEDDFYAAYGRLSAGLGDVSSESIEWSRTNGNRATLWMAGLGALVLLCLLYIQYRVIYLYDSSTNYTQTYAALNKAQSDLDTIYIKLRLLEEAPATAVTGTSEIPESESELRGEGNRLEAEISRLKNRLTAQYLILSEWVSNIEGDPAPKKPGWFSSDQDEADYEAALAAWRQKQEELKPHEQAYGIQQAESQLRLLNNYILPAIYGVLGTIAFILRQISIRLQAQSLRLSTIMNYLVRLPLGALSGIAIGLLLRPEEGAEGLAALQPLALAFVAGYSVELVFTAMDRLVMAFTGGPKGA